MQKEQSGKSTQSKGASISSRGGNGGSSSSSSSSRSGSSSSRSGGSSSAGRDLRMFELGDGIARSAALFGQSEAVKQKRAEERRRASIPISERMSSAAHAPARG